MLLYMYKTMNAGVLHRELGVLTQTQRSPFTNTQIGQVDIANN